MSLPRRAVLGFGLVAPLLPAAVLAAPQATAEEPDIVSDLDKEAWIDTALSLPAARGSPYGVLTTGRFRDPFYYLKAPIAWRPGAGDPAGLPVINVPAGFVTDFASIPPVLFSVLRPDGDYVYAAVLHDYLYWQQTTSRDVADRVLRTAMVDFDVAPLTVTAIYRGVRFGGGAAWASNRALRRSGEKRVLKQVPDDPRTTWTEWKRKPGVFV